ncbi:MAG: hypothetical protein Q8M03_01335 [Legionella sp.]|nr:hypothetical protein [Legionella sp.]
MPNTKHRDSFFKKHEPEISEVMSDDELEELYDELYRQQAALYQGEDKNPDKDIYGGIIALSSERKATLQQRLRDVTTKHSPMIYPYSLCLNLKGLTYYELFKNTIEFIYLNPDLDPLEAEAYKKGYEFLIEVVDSFSLPSAESTTEMTDKEYNRLATLIRNLTPLYFYNSKQYEFLHQPPRRYYAEQRFAGEVNRAIESVMNHAKRLVKSNDQIVEGITPRI